MYSLGFSGENLRTIFSPQIGYTEFSFTIGTRSIIESIFFGDLLEKSGFSIEGRLSLRNFDELDLNEFLITSKKRTEIFDEFWPEIQHLKVNLKKSEVDKFLEFLKNLKGWKTAYALRSNKAAIIK